MQAVNDNDQSDWTSGSFRTVSAPDVVTLLSPTDETIINTVNPVLSWEAVQEAENYRLHLSDNAEFTTFDSVEITETSFTITEELDNNTTYYWRVLASNSVGDGELSEVFSFSTPALPSTPQLLSPEDQATDLELPIELSWTAQDADEYMVEILINQSTGDTIRTSETSYSVENLASNTGYTWRVRGINENGTGAWSAQRSFYTVGIPPAPPELSSPLNGASIESEWLVELSWNYSDRATMYKVQLATDSVFNDIYNERETSWNGLTSFIPLNCNKFYWRVQAYNDEGYSEWSEIRMFYTPSDLQAPELISPDFDTILSEPTVDLQWSTVSDAESYHIMVEEENNETGERITYVDEDVTGTSHSLDGLEHDRTYHWKVRAENITGQSNFSDEWRFVVQIPSLAPQLVSPEDGLTISPFDITLDWESSPLALSYRVNVFDSEDNLIVNDSNLTETEYTLDLDQSQTFTWWVSATDDQGQADTSESWSFTTGTLPSEPLLASPENNLTVDTLKPTFEWEIADEAAGYVFELSDGPNFETKVESLSLDVNTYTLTDELDNGSTYYWRVRGVNTFGPGQVSQPYSFTIQLLPPGIPTLTYPADGEEDIPLTDTLRWQDVEAADTYEVQVALDDDFTDPLYQETPTRPLFVLSGLDESTQHFWRVRASNVNGSGEWSDTLSFSTGSLPKSPGLVSPVAGNPVDTVSPTFTWKKVSDALEYDFIVSKSFDFSRDPIERGSISDTTFRLPNLTNNQKYYWKVRSVNNIGIGNYSDVDSFVVNALPPVPNLISPDDQETDMPLRVTLDWQRSSSSDDYTLQVFMDEDFLADTVLDTTVSASEFETIALTANTTYFWRVRGNNNHGSNEWSQIRSFTTAPLPSSAPQLVLPENGTLIGTLSPTLSWEEVTNAASYIVKLARDSSFTDGSEDTVTALIFETPELDRYTTYYWQITALSNAGAGEPSNIRSFSVPNTVDAPVLVLPEDESTVPISIDLSWEEVNGATSYCVELATNTGFSNKIVDTADLTSLSLALSDLDYNTTYYWRVRAVNSLGAGSWTGRSFVTQIAPASIPELTSPSSGSETAAFAQTLNWGEVSTAQSYTVQVCTTSSFENNLIDTTLSATSLDLADLSNNTTYYWRVSAENETGASAFSQPWSFTVAVLPAGPVLVGPADEAQDLSRPVVLSWKSAAHAVSYKVQIATDADFDQLAVDSAQVNDTAFSFSGGDYNTTYFWRIEATNAAGGAWSSARQFKTRIAPPETVTLSSPSDSTQNVAVDCTLKWKASARAQMYTLQISKDKNFEESVVEKDSLSDTSFQMSELENNTTYFWRVRAFNTTGKGGWATIRNFTTIVALPQSPVVVGDDVDTLVTEEATCLWNDMELVTRYAFVLFGDSALSDTILYNDTLTDTSITLDGLTNNKTYWWKVKGYNAAGWGDESRAYQIVVKRPEVPVLPKAFALRFTGASIRRNSVSFDLPNRSNVEMVIYDLRGRIIQTCVSGLYDPGSYRISIGNRAAGKYFLSFRAGKYQRLIPFTSY